MQKTGQNLFIFFDKSNYEPDFSSNIAKLAMNRFIIDEEARFEVIQVYYLQPGKESPTTMPYNVESYSYSRSDCDKWWAESLEKFELDLETVCGALNVASTISKGYIDTHFIIGSRFHSKVAAYPIDYWENKPRPLIFDKIEDLIPKNRRHSLQCTILEGVRTNLITYEMSMDYFSSKVMPLSMAYQTKEGRPDNQPKPTVNDDLETLMQDIQKSSLHKEQFTCSYLHPTLTEEESQEVKNSKSKFWIKVDRKTSFLGNLTLLFDQNVRKFINIHCKRCSVLIK